MIKKIDSNVSVYQYRYVNTDTSFKLYENDKCILTIPFKGE